MSNIGLIDDSKDNLDTVLGLAKPILDQEHPNWAIIGIHPLKDIEDYDSWIRENSINVLVVDERLNERMDNGEAVDYRGHDLVIYLRKSWKELPIFILSSWVEEDGELEDPDLQKKVEFQVDRLKFYNNPEILIEKMVRSGTRFFEENQKGLTRLSELAQKSATGNISEKEQEEIGALQLAIGRDFGLTEVKGSLLREFDDKLTELEVEIRAILDAKGKSKQ